MLFLIKATFVVFQYTLCDVVMTISVCKHKRRSEMETEDLFCQFREKADESDVTNGCRVRTERQGDPL